MMNKIWTIYFVPGPGCICYLLHPLEAKFPLGLLPRVEMKFRKIWDPHGLPMCFFSFLPSSSEYLV